ncbi:oxidoreductase [Cupriavidus basilensis OR16]|uniref:Oxidoreductase n=2 Tax=Cupriavidus basilensis TaxID=68895 RepID=H1S386_9BURK|nr:oxidoreductase [Cupriavidus basilensis OR16]
MAVQSRKSVRGFLPTPVPPEVIRDVLEQAARAPSGGNLQPWHLHVVGGEPLERLKATMRERIAGMPGGEGSEYDIYPRELVSPYRERRFQVGEDLYRCLGIPRENKPARMAQFANCTVDRRMGPPQWSDLGMYLQTVMLLLCEHGLDSCAQECWAIYPETISGFLAIPPERMLFTGMAIGYEDTEAPVNQLRATRAPLAEFAEFIGI